MRRSVPFLSAPAIAGVFVCAGAQAASAYKCVAADGAVSFQDTPCAASSREQRVRLADDVAPPPAPAADAPPAADDDSAKLPKTAMPPAPRAPPTYLCVRYDGSHYLSETGIGSRTAVPYAMLGDSGQGLAEAYGGRNGIGVSAPGLRTIPHVPAASAPLAGAYVWVDDRCHAIGAGEACMYRRGELGEVESKLRHAFSDTEAALRDEADALRKRLGGCR